MSSQIEEIEDDTVLSKDEMYKLIGKVFYIATSNQDYLGMLLGITENGDLTLNYPMQININYWSSEDEDDQDRIITNFSPAFPLTISTIHTFKEPFILTAGIANAEMTQQYLKYYSTKLAQERLNLLYSVASKIGVNIKVVDTPKETTKEESQEFDPVNTDGKIIPIKPTKTLQ